MSSLTNEGLFLFLYTARAVHEPARANGAGLGAKRRGREPSMSPSGRMGQGLELREERARAVHEPARANGAWLGAKRRGRKPSMSPSGRMEQGLEQREEGASRFRARVKFL